jgi:phosphatidylserine synthase
VSLRILETVVAVGNCVYGALLLGVYGREALHPPVGLPATDQQALWLVAIMVLPIAVFGLRYTLAAGILEFATAFVGNQMLHNAPFPDLRLVSSISMTIALVVLGLAVFNGILQVTREAFGEAEDPDEQQAHSAA